MTQPPNTGDQPLPDPTAAPDPAASEVAADRTQVVRPGQNSGESADRTQVVPGGAGGATQAVPPSGQWYGAPQGQPQAAPPQWGQPQVQQPGWGQAPAQPQAQQWGQPDPTWGQQPAVAGQQQWGAQPAAPQAQQQWGQPNPAAQWGQPDPAAAQWGAAPGAQAAWGQPPAAPQAQQWGQPAVGQQPGYAVPPGYGQQPGHGQSATVVPTGVLAGWGSRFLARLIDGGASGAPLIVCWLLAAVVGSEGVALVLSLVGLLLSLAVGIYNIHRQGTTGQSIGKGVMKIMVVGMETRQVLGFGGAFLRELCGVVNSIACGLPIGWLAPLWDEQGQTWSDKIMKTQVFEAHTM